MLHNLPDCAKLKDLVAHQEPETMQILSAWAFKTFSAYNCDDVRERFAALFIAGYYAAKGEVQE